jgi:hypothetical protein
VLKILRVQKFFSAFNRHFRFNICYHLINFPSFDQFDRYRHLINFNIQSICAGLSLIELEKYYFGKSFDQFSVIWSITSISSSDLFQHFINLIGNIIWLISTFNQFVLGLFRQKVNCLLYCTYIFLKYVQNIRNVFREKRRIIPNVRDPAFPVYIYILYKKIRDNKINILVEIREVLRSICNIYII